ncbi:ATP-binding protein [Hydrogenophaga sp.]|uniref:ATP-binding protein n=1 Tax=Hydrogenophaga sp. TaxID=1904254 RepID=UPI0035B4C5C7
MQKTPWINSVTLPKDDTVLKGAVRIEPVPVCDIDKLPVDVAVELLHAALKVPYRASDQHIGIIRQLLGPMLAHAVLHYGSEEQFIRAAMGQLNLPLDPRITVLTGQPGVGKSALLLAIARLIPSGEKIQVCGDLPQFPLNPIVHLPIRSNISKAEMYDLIAGRIGLGHDYEARSEGDLRHLQLRMVQHGCCGILTDELQFVTRSSNANSQVSVLITRLADFGIPLTLTMNYSLVHKLKRRPPEERARVLSSPIVMLPDHGDDPGYRAYLDDLKVVMDGRLKIDPHKDSHEIASLTGGLKRPLLRLISVAYKLARRQSGKTTQEVVVQMNHLHQAYESLDFEEDRKLVEQCHRALLGLGNVGDEYTCPFDLPPHQAKQMEDRANELRQRQLAKSELAAAVGKSATQARLADEREATPSPQIRVPAAAKSNQQSRTTTRRTPPPRVATDLIAGLNRLLKR